MPSISSPAAVLPSGKMIVFITMHVSAEICTWARPSPPGMGNLAIIPGFRGKLGQVVDHFWGATPGYFSRVPKSSSLLSEFVQVGCARQAPFEPANMVALRFGKRGDRICCVNCQILPHARRGGRARLLALPRVRGELSKTRPGKILRQSSVEVRVWARATVTS